jgi:hypothetical protein
MNVADSQLPRIDPWRGQLDDPLLTNEGKPAREHRVEAMSGQRLQLWLPGRKRLGDDALGGAVDADIGDSIKPVDELSVEVVEVAEAAAEEEVLADVAERPLDLSLCLGPIEPAGARLKAIGPGRRSLVAWSASVM